MVVLDTDNRQVRLLGFDSKLLGKLDRATSYPVKGARFTTSYQYGRWDGREHLLVYRRTPPSGYYLPFGMLSDAISFCNKRKIDFELKTNRRRPQGEGIDLGWNPEFDLRPYQLGATVTITAPGWRQGTGIIKLPPRTGKTRTAAAIIRALRARTMFMVPNLTLLGQTQDALEDIFQTKVATIGDSHWATSDLTVASIQSLSAARTNKDPRYQEILDQYDLVVFDECHHLRGREWRKVMLDFDAPFKLGLSATAYLSNKEENERGVIWLKACCGDVRVDISPSEMIEDGYLVRPTINLYRICEPNLASAESFQDALKDGIYQNEYRNQYIMALAHDLAKEDHKILVVTNRLVQVDRLLALMKSVKLKAAKVTGNTFLGTRKSLFRKLAEGKLQVLVGTVFGEGVDIPEADVVINAEGGKDAKAVVQRMRNLTVSEGKDEAIVIDFIDETNPYLADHSLHRLREYRAEPAFQVNITA